MMGSDQGPGSKPISEEDVMAMIFSKWGMKLAGFILLVFGAYVASLILFGF
jgi:hypothetical protein